MTIAQMLGYVKDISVTAMFIIFVYGGYKRWWVWGYQLEESKAACEEWKKIALRSLGHSEQATAIVQQTVSK